VEHGHRGGTFIPGLDSQIARVTCCDDSSFSCHPIIEILTPLGKIHNFPSNRSFPNKASNRAAGKQSCV